MAVRGPNSNPVQLVPARRKLLGQDMEQTKHPPVAVGGGRFLVIFQRSRSAEALPSPKWAAMGQRNVLYYYLAVLKL
jgi:hypothetical protein